MNTINDRPDPEWRGALRTGRVLTAVCILIILWAGVVLRDRGVRAFIPLRTRNGA